MTPTASSTRRRAERARDWEWVGHVVLRLSFMPNSRSWRDVLDESVSVLSSPRQWLAVCSCLAAHSRSCSLNRSGASGHLFVGPGVLRTESPYGVHKARAGPPPVIHRDTYHKSAVTEVELQWTNGMTSGMPRRRARESSQTKDVVKLRLNGAIMSALGAHCLSARQTIAM
jgi:hypothetical protein